jgi:hypothetical protein
VTAKGCSSWREQPALFDAELGMDTESEAATDHWLLLVLLSQPLLSPNTTCVGLPRFNKIASRNWDRMKATANQAYTMTVKPVMDRLSGDQQQ